MEHRKQDVRKYQPLPPSPWPKQHEATQGSSSLFQPAFAHGRGAEEAACVVTATIDHSGALCSGSKLATTVIPPHKTEVSQEL